MTADSSKRVLLGFVWAGLGAALAVLIMWGTESRSAEEPAEAVEPAAAAAPETKTEPPPPPKPKLIPRRQLVDSRSHALELEQLQALGYVDGTYDPESELENVLVHDEKAAQQGLNFYSSRKSAGARLMDMQGRTVHQWKAKQKGAWQHAELLPSGHVVVIVKDRRLSRYDERSNLLWSVKARFHHDLWIAGDEIYVLARKAQVVDYVHPKLPVLVDVIQVRALEDGTLKREISVLDSLHESDYGFLLPSIRHIGQTKKNRQLDILHTNHVEVFDGSQAHRGPLYARGNILISMRNINAIAVLDGSSGDVLWIWGPSNVTFQHHPTLLENGHILLFDNGLERSRVIEIDPSSFEIVWTYAPASGLFSKTRGSNQRLANGNTLITESDRGYVIEVTPDQKVVWKFANPIVNEKKEREAIWRMVRVDPASLQFLD
ncbi:MAG TPA: arylsulfotransferase family protein [Polyangiales bacterium]|nr:arylsulfotransferase family protein [Polyangiales bacterium]